MRFCERFHITPSEYPEQPADFVVKWRQMVRAENEGLAMAQKISEAQAKARASVARH